MNALFCVFALVIGISLPHSLFAKVHESQTIISHAVWSLADSPHYIRGDVSVADQAKLTIEPGSMLILNECATLIIDGDIDNTGTIHIRSDDGTGSLYFVNNTETTKNVSNISMKNIQVIFSGNAFRVHNIANDGGVVGLRFENTQTVATGLTVASSSVAGIQILSDVFHIASSTIVDNALGIDVINKRAYQVCTIVCRANRLFAWLFASTYADVERVIVYSHFQNNDIALRNKRSNSVDARHNWWGGSPVQSGQNSIVGVVDYEPWNEEQEVCCSNILFLPGMQASRLVETSGTKNIKRWEPGGNGDVRKLFLNSDGSSLGNIFAPAPIDAIRFWNYKNAVYEQFLSDLQEYKKQGSINNYRTYGYDWRLDPESYIDDVVSVVVSLASSSKTKRVSIVGHSMGGLIGRLLIRKLDERGLASLVDKAIFVGTPHVGAPQAYGAILHGDGQEYVGGLIVSATNGRALAKNMISAHMLLPALPHVSALNVSIDCGKTTICSGVLRDGLGIESFLKEHRNVLTVRDPESLSESILDRARVLQAQIYEKWGMDGIATTNIVGKGVQTSRGLRYEEIIKHICARGGGGGACVTSKTLDHSHIKDGDGDGTVPAISATGDLSNAHDITIDLPTLSTEEKHVIVHYNMLESAKVRRTLFEVLGLKPLLP